MTHPTTHDPPTARQAIRFRLSRLAATLALWMLAIFAWAWSLGFTHSLDDYFPVWIAKSLVIAIGIGIPWGWIGFRRSRPWLPAILLSLTFGACVLGNQFVRPSHDRTWSTAQAILPYADIDLGRSPTITVHNIRSNRYGPIAPSHKSHYDDTYDLSKLRSVWLGVDRFTSLEPMAHTFLSFEFEPGSHRSNFLAFSVETRRESDEPNYSPIRGLFKNYELIYVIADEQDVLAGRSDDVENIIQLYPIRTTPEGIRSLFLDMLDRTNSLREQPEFYHTLFNNCTNNIVQHTNCVIEQSISPWARGVVFPGYTDSLAHQRGIIDTELSLDDARIRFRIDERVKSYDGLSDFSEFIRAQRPQR
ncbi:MAG: hypothetical protein ACI87E_002146 [Mariniblastus sp.]|jgi:hypothetical protein